MENKIGFFLTLHDRVFTAKKFFSLFKPKSLIARAEKDLSNLKSGASKVNTDFVILRS
jgi:hypothetical protein